MNEELAELIRQAMTGDKTSFGKLVCRYKHHIVNIAFGIVGNPHDAEEIAQEAFLKAYLSIYKLTSETAFYRWLVKITTNLSIDRKNANAKQYPAPLEEMGTILDNPRYTPEAILEQKERQRLILTALEQLTAEQRTVIVLRELQGFAYDEIAEILDIPLGTVKSRINTARLHLRDILTQERS
ncbi:ECF RNA polymerase sigma factor SigW [Sporomusa carbonis]|uniref:RNA polymerase sigma factor n=1 Tax=Sporomusa carbonis TaxID=3076075 RepID=UPI003A630633